MENILRLKPEIIKIDGTLIKNLDTNNDTKILVKNIISMAKELNASCVAEYVHNKEVCDICQELQIDYLQGFYLGAPSLKIIKQRYHDAFKDKDLFVSYMVQWVYNPTKEGSIMIDMIDKYELMPQLGYHKDTLEEIAEYIYENEIEDISAY